MTDARDLNDREFDVIIVGGGIAGSLVAKQLGDLKWRVAVLEAGTDILSTQEGYQDAIDTFQAALAKVPNSPYAKNPAVPSSDVLDLAPDTWRSGGYLIQDGTHPYGSDYLRTLGGTGNHWMGLCPRMLPDDFRIQTDYKVGLNWPLGYKELEPYYEKAEYELGVAGDAEFLRQEMKFPIRDGYAFPMKAIPASTVDGWTALAANGAEVKDPETGLSYQLKVAPTPSARTSDPNPDYDSGNGYKVPSAWGVPNTGERCVGNSSCVPICPAKAKYSPLRTQQRFDSDHVTLVTRACVSKVLLDSNGAATGVQYKVYDDPSSSSYTLCTVRAKIVVLAAHAIENARLMLESHMCPGNDHLGRYLMDHPVVLSWARVPMNVGPFRGPGSTSAIETLRTGKGRETRAPFRMTISNWGWGWPTGAPYSDVAEELGIPTGSPAFGMNLRSRIVNRVIGQVALYTELEQVADKGNRVMLSDRKDRLGNLRPKVTYNISDYMLKGMASGRAVASEIFRRMGAIEHTQHPAEGPNHLMYKGQHYVYFGGGHGAGTHIMGTSEKDSVVDTYQRVHQHRNVFAVSCGSMPSVGTSNPTNTMAALAMRSAEQIHEELHGMRTATTRGVA